LPAAYLEISQVVDIAKEGAKAGCLEALFTLGDRPEDRWDVAAEWLSERGYSSTLDYLRACAIAVLEETGLLPHLNPGVMSFEEMSRLRPVAASMGMMLETSSTRLFTEKGEVHFGSPDKDPAVRLRTIEDAGKLNIPFTTGILVGIGETIAERADSLLKMAEIAKTYGHVQEIIIQNFRAKEDTAMRNSPDADRAEYLACIAVARLIFGPRMRIQAPPNLSEPSEFAELISAGIDDWGGVSPITADHVNPERPWPEIELLAQQSKLAGFELKPRLTIYSNYVNSPERWIDPKMKSHIAALADSNGLAKAKVIPVGTPWQESGESLQSLGRTDLGNSIDTAGREADSRSDFDSIYGDWQSISEKLKSLKNTDSPFIKSSFVSALTKIVENPRSVSRSEALTLFAADGPELELLVKAADEKRAELVGDDVTYIVNRNINFTNVCYTGCRFCAFAQRNSASACNWRTLSTPSATMSKPSESPMAMMVRTSDRALRSSATPLTNDRSIFRRCIGNFCNNEREEYPVPKSSMATRTPSAHNLFNASRACSGCAIITPSVISSHSWSGAICERRSAS
jgi:FO synthase